MPASSFLANARLKLLIEEPYHYNFDVRFKILRTTHGHRRDVGNLLRKVCESSERCERSEICELSDERLVD
jgi:hypothetical protein